MRHFSLLLRLFFLLGIYSVTGQSYEQFCEQCVAQEGLYCGDDESNWTQYAPNGCVQTAWLNDGWEDCVDASDETGEDGVPAEPSSIENCGTTPEECDTVYVDIPVIEYVNTTDTLEIPFYVYETIIEIDTLYQTEYITEIVIDTLIEEVFIPEYIYVTDTVYADVLDTMFIDVIEYVDSIIYDTVIETEYIEFFITDTIVEYQQIVETEYLDCESGLPCGSSMEEIIKESETNNLLYNLQGQVIRKPKGLYIKNGKVKWHK